MLSTMRAAALYLEGNVARGNTEVRMKIHYQKLQSILSASDIAALTTHAENAGYPLTEIPMRGVLEVCSTEVTLKALMLFCKTPYHSVVQSVAIALAVPTGKKLIDERQVLAMNMMLQWLMESADRDEIMRTAKKLAQDSLSAAQANYELQERINNGHADASIVSAAQALIEALNPDLYQVFQLTLATLLAGIKESERAGTRHQYESYCRKQILRALDLAETTA
ncbi:hypothetical protein ACOTHJ_15755 [Achromobacter xylosoxidans]